MNIIHVEDRFEPNAGYQINEMIKQHCKNKENNVFLITSDLPIFSDNIKQLKSYDKELLNRFNNLTIMRIKPKFILSSRYYFPKLLKKIDDLNPDILYLHGIVDFKDLILLKNKEYLIFRDCHMSRSGSQNRLSKQIIKFYNLFFSKMASKKYQKVYYLGEEEREYISSIGIIKDKQSPLLHGYDGSVMYYSNMERNRIRDSLHINNDEILITYTGKLDHYKEPHLIFDIIEGVSIDNIDKLKILFVGNINSEYKQLFLNRYNEFEFKEKCIFLDSVPYEELYKYYSASDICIWPKQCTLSALHGQVCRTLAVLEKQDSNIERVFHHDNLYEKNNINQASMILDRIISNEEYLISDEEYSKILDHFSSRDYNKQIVNLEESWRQILGEVK